MVLAVVTLTVVVITVVVVTVVVVTVTGVVVTVVVVNVTGVAVTVVVVSGVLVDISIATKSYSSFGSSLPVKYPPRFSDQVGHQAMSVYIENKHFFTKLHSIWSYKKWSYKNHQ